MKIKLCYKEYAFKLSEGACKRFNEETGGEIQQTLLDYMNASVESRDMPDIGKKLSHFYSVCNRYDAAKLLHNMIAEEDKSIPLAEIEDAMFRVAWTSGIDDDWAQPWCLVMLQVATKINKYYEDNLPKKKAGI